MDKGIMECLRVDTILRLFRRKTVSPLLTRAKQSEAKASSDTTYKYQFNYMSKNVRSKEIGKFDEILSVWVFIDLFFRSVTFTKFIYVAFVNLLGPFYLSLFE